MALLALLPLLIAANSGGLLAEEEALPFQMPTPTGWSTETIAFPLGFAPELDYEGLEELRFSPGMFKEGSPEFWTYAFVWWLFGDAQLDADSLKKDLEAYFRGLSAAVAQGKDFDLTEARFEAKISELDNNAKGQRKLEGHIASFDSFVTGKPVELEVRITIWDCSPEHRVAFFELSPQPFSHQVWEQLGDIREGFACPE